MSEENTVITWDSVRNTFLTAEERMESYTMAVISAKLFLLQNEAGLHDKDLKKIIKRDDIFIGKIDKGVSNPTLDNLLMLLLIFGYTLDVVPIDEK